MGLLDRLIGVEKNNQKPTEKLIWQMIDEGAILVDVRFERLYQLEHSSYSINIPLYKVETGEYELDRDKNIIVCCANGLLSNMAIDVFRKSGYPHLFNGGNFKSYCVRPKT